MRQQGILSDERVLEKVARWCPGHMKSVDCGEDIALGIEQIGGRRKAEPRH